jgi:predicted AAA+ superfamily ATPase
MLERTLIDILRKDLRQVPAVVLFGPRQVGKTTMARELAAASPNDFVYFDLELPSDRIRFSDPELFLRGLADRTVILDEVQVLPELFPVLRGLIDQDRRPGRFLLLGSVSPALLQQSSESLAGRIRFREVMPLTLREAGGSDFLEHLWVRGGYPVSFLAKDDQEAMAWHADFVHSYATRDLALMGLAMSPPDIERLLLMLAHVHGQLVNYSQLSRALGVSQPTVRNALDYFEHAMLIRTLRPWHSNAKKRLVKTPKLYIRDSGMLHYLLGISGYQALLGHPQAGNSWEGFVVQQVISVMPRDMQAWFYRTAGGAELDLVITRGGKAAFAIEAKLTLSPKPTRGNTEAVQDLALPPEHQFIVAPVRGSFPLPGGWEVCEVGEVVRNLSVDG